MRFVCDAAFSTAIGNASPSQASTVDTGPSVLTYSSGGKPHVMEAERRSRRGGGGCGLDASRARERCALADGKVHDAFPRQATYMTNANQGKDMLARMKQLGLVVYAGVFTTAKTVRARDGWGVQHQERFLYEGRKGSVPRCLPRRAGR